jgi:hypothetical protein
MFFSELYLGPGSQVSRVRADDGWSTVFRYTEQQWQLISKEIGDEDRRFVYGEFEYDARSLLEIFAIRCLNDGTPEQRRAYHDDRVESLRGYGRAFLDFANALGKLGFDDEDVLEEETHRLKVGDLRKTADVYLGSSHKMETLDVLVGSYEPRPRGREDPARTEYLNGLCRFWRENLGRRVSSSVNEGGEAAGPMVRFLIACSGPIFTGRNTTLLTPAGARAIIRSYAIGVREANRRIIQTQRERRRMAKQLRLEHRVSP